MAKLLVLLGGSQVSIANLINCISEASSASIRAAPLTLGHLLLQVELVLEHLLAQLHQQLVFESARTHGELLLEVVHALLQRLDVGQVGVCLSSRRANHDSCAAVVDALDVDGLRRL